MGTAHPLFHSCCEVMKVHCDGFSGWFETCPSPGRTLQPGQLFYDEQVAHISLALVVIFVVALALLLTVTIATLTD